MMIKFYLSIVLLIGIGSSHANAKSLLAYFSYCTFYSPENGPYVENYLSVIGSTAKYVQLKNKKFQSSVQVTITYKQGDSIKYFDKYNLLSPETDDTNDIAFNFLDQYRTVIPNGKYTLDISIKDNHSASEFRLEQPIEVDFNYNAISISDIQLLESYKKSETPTKITKSGYDLVPYVSNFFGKNLKSIKFYAEIYNANVVLGEESFLVEYSIRSHESNRKIGKYVRFSKQKAGPANVIMGEFPIQALPSGNYNVVVEVRNKSNKILSSNKVFFQRSNPDLMLSDISLIDISESFATKYKSNELKDHIACIAPISTANEIKYAENVLHQRDTLIKAKYFHNFWQNRDPSNPAKAWEAYHKQVVKVNKSYSTLLYKGYETDRGRIYLQYGSPNDKELFEGGRPYEIWQYYKVKNQRNVKFVFYQVNIGSDDFELIHSNAIGEITNNNWESLVEVSDIMR